MRMTDQRSENQLIAAYLDGDEDSFGVLVGRHFRLVYGFVRRVVIDGGEAEDVTQETFIRVWKNLKRYRAGGSFKVWLYTIARNAAYDQLRRKRPAAFSDFDGEDGSNVLTDSLADPAPLPDEIAATAAAREMLADLVGRLPPHFRAVIALRRDADLGFEEIATVLDRPVDTVKSHYRRAVERLRRLLAEELKDRGRSG